MKIFLSEWFPDEILFSVVARYINDRPWSSLYAVLRVTYGYVPAVSFLGNGLDHLSMSTSSCWGLSATEIAEKLTCYPYFAALIQPQKREKLLGWMNAKATDIRAGNEVRLAPMGAHGIRFCERCFSDDRRGGTPLYWRRVHQLPGVIFCPWHAELLWEIPDFKRHRNGFFSPDIRWDLTPQQPDLNLSELQRFCCVEVAKISLFLLNEKITVCPETVPSHLLMVFENISPYFRGWRKSTCIARLFEMCFGKAYLMLNGLATKETGLNTTIRFVFGKGRVCAPLRLVLCAVMAKAIENYPNIVEERVFADLYGIPSNRVRPAVNKDQPIKRLNCPNVSAKHGPDHPFGLVMRKGGYIYATCTCGMTFNYPDSSEINSCEVKVSRWSQGHINRVLHMNSLGKSQREIGLSLDIPTSSVGNILRRNGVIAKLKRRKR
ncbi:TniQ family protein [Paraburkholderia flagellata]|uniref:TniQ family protein n=1 Tax=Paraburkholderia flagellata TaxID=2883241 RepID=UPI001F3D356E|nr:TniQ family protein [Paraburkholderia flagellata]